MNSRRPREFGDEALREERAEEAFEGLRPRM
jgi:hypothetical protein